MFYSLQNSSIIANFVVKTVSLLPILESIEERFPIVKLKKNSPKNIQIIDKNISK